MEVVKDKERGSTNICKVLKTFQVGKIMSQVPRTCRRRKTLEEKREKYMQFSPLDTKPCTSCIATRENALLCFYFLPRAPCVLGKCSLCTHLYSSKASQFMTKASNQIIKEESQTSSNLFLEHVLFFLFGYVFCYHK